MANIIKRGNTYQIRVSCGYDTKGNQVVQTKSWRPPESMTAKQAEKEVHRQTALTQDDSSSSELYQRRVRIRCKNGYALGPEWKDIDFENNVISIKRTSNYTKERGTYTDTTKTKKSQRSLKFHDHVMKLLGDFKSVRTFGHRYNDYHLLPHISASTGKSRRRYRKRTRFFQEARSGIRQSAHDKGHESRLKESGSYTKIQ